MGVAVRLAGVDAVLRVRMHVRVRVCVLVCGALGVRLGMRLGRKHGATTFFEASLALFVLVLLVVRSEALWGRSGAHKGFPSSPQEHSK